ncbi:hypothetical protein D047_1366B, partial [Vibrio parahaemolyticus VPTS-2010_2]
NTTMI